MYLKHLSLSGFRGVGSRLDLPLDYRTIIYGPNGSGKSSVLQAIAWSIYGKLPFLTGNAFTREDALVNDFLGNGTAQIVLSFSDGVTIRRGREKQGSTTRGKNPLTLSTDAQDAQSHIEQAVGLNPEEFFAAVFLHQETIREFITTTPDKRSATIDRMLGTFLLRTLVRVVDPGIPAKAIEEAQDAIARIDVQLAQASVISREMIEQRKAEYGDPAELERLLDRTREDLAPFAARLGTAIPEATLSGIEGVLVALRQGQVDTISALEKRAGQVYALKERYHQAAVISWQAVHQRRAQHGDPAELPNLLAEIRQDLISLVEKLGLSAPQPSIAELEATLTAARQAQPRLVGQQKERAGWLATLRERYEQAAVTSWEPVQQRRAQWGDPAQLPELLQHLQSGLAPICAKLGVASPQPRLTELEDTLAAARRAQPGAVGKLEKRAGQLDTLRERYEQMAARVPEQVSVPSGLRHRLAGLGDQINAVNRESSALSRTISQRQRIVEELGRLPPPAEALPRLRTECEQIQLQLDALEAAGRRGKLYNQLLQVGGDYLEQARPEHCPLCKREIPDLCLVLESLRQETPQDVEQLRKDYSALQATLAQKQSQVSQLEKLQEQIAALERELRGFPADLESQLEQKEDESHRLLSESAAIEAEVAGIEARVNLAEENKRLLAAVLLDIERELGRPPGADLSACLISEIQATREQAAAIAALNLEPLAADLDHARQLRQIDADEAELRRNLAKVLDDAKQGLGHNPKGDVASALDAEIETARLRAADVQVLDFQPVAAKLDRAKQLDLILSEEAELREQLDQVLAQVRGLLGRPPGDDVVDALDKATQAIHAQVAEMQALDFQPIVRALDRARQLSEIQKDESRLREYESNYQTASREKARLRRQIERLTDLRNALHDIAETTKRHQEAIVTGILTDLDIGRYYAQLDPHPAYRLLQIEPELTKEGTYEYWIRALTDDRSHSTYIQTRFSTAQANCAAIAIFLAVNQHLSKKLETVILDDPSQSMDLEHQRHLAQTLATIPRQVIVATEDPRMFELLSDAFEKPTIHELSPWTVAGTAFAPVIGRY